MPRGDDEDDRVIKDGLAHRHSSSRITRPESQSMLLPKQTLSTPSPSDSSSSSLSSRTAIQTSPPTLTHALVPLQQQQPADGRPLPDYDMHLYEDEDMDWAARRRRVHGKRRRRDDAPPLITRAGCEGLDNSMLSCQPSVGQLVVQNQWFQFQWSSYHPLFNQVDNVHIYLFNGDSGGQIGFWDENKLQGSIQIQANDTFWGASGPSLRPNHNQSFPFYFVIIPSTALVHHGETSQPTFTGVQTALPNSVLATMSTGSLASSASVASVSSRSVASVSAASASLLSTSSSGSGSLSTSSQYPTGGMQGGSGGSSHFPSWAIALITILAFFLLLAVVLGFYLITRRIRRQREQEARRNSIGSASPMIDVDERKQPHSPIDAAAPSIVGGAADEKLASHPGGTLGGPAAGYGSRDIPVGGTGSIGHGGDGTSIISGSDTPGMLSVADAAIVAGAYRRAMREPDFSARPVVEDESPDQPEASSELEHQLISQELAKEGRDIRSVSSARDVKVQSTPPS